MLDAGKDEAGWRWTADLEAVPELGDPGRAGTQARKNSLSDTMCLLDQLVEMSPLWSLGSRVGVGAAALPWSGDKATALESGRSWNVRVSCRYRPHGLEQVT